VLFEILALERAGLDVHFYPLLRHRMAVAHPEAIEVMQRARYLPFLSLPILRSQLHFLRRSPGAYLRALWDVLRGTWGSVNFFFGAIGIFPKSAHIARLMRDAGVRHVHCHYSTHPAVAGLVITRLVGIPFSFTAQGSDLHVDRTMLCEKIAEARFVVTVSDFNREVIREECGSAATEKVEILHSGVDPDFFSPPVGGRGHPGAIRIVCVGRLDEGKGQTHLIEACRLLAADGVDFVLQLVGDGETRHALTDQASAAGLDGRVVFEGSRPRAEVVEIMRAGDIMVAPSVGTSDGKKEGIPIVLMEALSTEIAVVASDLAGISELVADERTGLLVPPGDPLVLAGALQRLAGDPELRRRLGAAGRGQVLREFDAYANGAALGRRMLED
jgi:glycosyltransferase involved in cell wall biosynthesis